MGVNGMLWCERIFFSFLKLADENIYRTFFGPNFIPSRQLNSFVCIITRKARRSEQKAGDRILQWTFMTGSLQTHRHVFCDMPLYLDFF